MDGERPIEKLLRRYAKKRRDDAGAPQEIHPATRRLLQGEVARQFKKERAEGTERSSVSWLPRFVYAACALGILGLLAALLLPALNKGKSRSLGMASVSNLRQIDSAARSFAEDNNDRLPATFDQLSNELRSSTVTVDPVTGKPFVFVAAGQPLKKLAADSVVAYSPPTNNRSAVLLADGRVEMMTKEKLDEIADRGLLRFDQPMEMAKAPEPTAAPAFEFKAAKDTDKAKDLPLELGEATLADSRRATETLSASKTGPAVAQPAPVAIAAAPASTPPPARMNAMKTGARSDDTTALDESMTHSLTTNSAQTIVSFVNQQATPISGEMDASRKYEAEQTALFRNVQNLRAKLVVLDSFKVEQNGNDLRVIDNDGSTYNGNIVVGAVQAPPGATFALAGRAEEAAARSRSFGGAALNLNREQEAPAQQNFYFQVSGTNRTLNQNVVFTGNFIPATNAVLNQMPVQNIPQVQNAQNFPLFINNSIIVGKAQVEKSQLIDVNAVPVTK